MQGKTISLWTQGPSITLTEYLRGTSSPVGYYGNMYFPIQVCSYLLELPGYSYISKLPLCYQVGMWLSSLNSNMLE